MEIKANRLDRGFFCHQEEYEKKALEVLRSGWYVLGNEVEAFEREFASYMGVGYCAGVGNGLDALVMAFRLLGVGPGDEVLVQGNTYIASVMGITLNGAKPVFVEPDEYYNIDVTQMEEKITCKTKAVLVVHLYGQVSDMGTISAIAKKYNLRIVEDCAQSHGAMYQNKMAGSFGDVGCFSFYPSKNLGAFGDGGAIVSNDVALVNKAKILRNYGSEKRYYNKMIGMNSRLDEFQAGLLRVRLGHLKEINEERLEIARYYMENIKNPRILLPHVREKVTSVWHQFVIRTDERPKLMEHLEGWKISTLIHYPIPPHMAEGYAYLGMKKGDLPITEAYADTVLSLPMYNGMTKEELNYVVGKINEF